MVAQRLVRFMIINWPIEVKENKYTKWYSELIQKAKDREYLDGYKERHHIVPNCFVRNNKKENLVYLTAREHYIAHLLLWKMTMEPIWHNKMTMALNIMVNGSGYEKQDRTYLVHSKIYETHRKEYSKYLSNTMSGEGNTFWGKKHTPESLEKMKAWQAVPDIKQKQSARVLGKNNPMFGKSHSEEVCKHLSKTSSASWDVERKKKQAEALKQRWADPEFKQRMLDIRKTSEAWANKDLEAIGKKAAATKKAKGWKMSEETKKKLSIARKENIASGEIASRKGIKTKPEYCGKNAPNSLHWNIKNPEGKVFTGVGRAELKETCKKLHIGYESALGLIKGKEGRNHLYLAGWCTDRSQIKRGRIQDIRSKNIDDGKAGD